MVDTFCSASQSFLCYPLAGHRVWANFPFAHLETFLRRYHAQKDLDPSIMGCFVVPVWRRAKWWPLVERFQVLAHYDAGTELFTAPEPDGSRRSRGPTRWAVEVRYDPSADERTRDTHVTRPDGVAKGRAAQAGAAGSAGSDQSPAAEL